MKINYKQKPMMDKPTYNMSGIFKHIGKIFTWENCDSWYIIPLENGHIKSLLYIPGPNNKLGKMHAAKVNDNTDAYQEVFTMAENMELSVDFG